MRLLAFKFFVNWLHGFWLVEATCQIYIFLEHVFKEDIVEIYVYQNWTCFNLLFLNNKNIHATAHNIFVSVRKSKYTDEVHQNSLANTSAGVMSNKISDQGLQLFWKVTPAQLLSCAVFEIFTEKLWETAAWQIVATCVLLCVLP